MAASSRWIRLLALVLLLPIFTASVINTRFETRSDTNGFTLRVRQDPTVDDPLDKSCFAYCELGTCTSSLCARNRPVISPYAVPANDRSSDVLNHTTEIQVQERQFTKRAFDEPRWTRSRAANYLVKQLVDNPGLNDPYFGQLQVYFDTTERTVINQDRFGDTAFQYGTPGLHGCTMLTVLSKRAVWQAHFWETYSTNKDDDVNDGGRWDQRVRNAVSGNGPLDTNLPASGGPVEPNLFITPDNDPQDKPLAIIMAPLRWEVGKINKDASSHPMSDYRYPNKLGKLKDTLTTIIPGIEVQMVAYFALNTKDPRDKEIQNTNERGMCLFQYDPNAEPGKRGWRLFYEQNFKQAVF